jgi:hypothetical protein
VAWTVKKYMSNFKSLCLIRFGQFGDMALGENNFNFNVKLDAMKWKRITHLARSAKGQTTDDGGHPASPYGFRLR